MSDEVKVDKKEIVLRVLNTGKETARVKLSSGNDVLVPKRLAVDLIGKELPAEYYKDIRITGKGRKGGKNLEDKTYAHEQVDKPKKKTLTEVINEVLNSNFEEVNKNISQLLTQNELKIRVATATGRDLTDFAKSGLFGQERSKFVKANRGSKTTNMPANEISDNVKNKNKTISKVVAGGVSEAVPSNPTEVTEEVTSLSDEVQAVSESTPTSDFLSIIEETDTEIKEQPFENTPFKTNEQKSEVGRINTNSWNV